MLLNDSLFEQSLKEREAFLEKIILEKTAVLENCIPGKLRIVHRGQQSYYFWRTRPKDTNGIYLPRKDYPLAQTLAQKAYDQKILHAAQEELALIKKLRKKRSAQSVENRSLMLENTYQDLIQPVILSDEAFVRQWQDMPYPKKHYWDDEKEFYTRRGDRVRSKSELLIANALDERNIPYRYECACSLKGFGTVYPDFTALNIRKRKQYLWEHMGMMDDPEYVKKAMHKLSLYEKNGYYPGDKLIITHETSAQPLKSKLISNMIDTFLV